MTKGNCVLKKYKEFLMSLGCSLWEDGSSDIGNCQAESTMCVGPINMVFVLWASRSRRWAQISEIPVDFSTLGLWRSLGICILNISDDPHISCPQLKLLQVASILRGTPNMVF